MIHRVLIVSGALGLGTALVFGAAALTASLFPNGATVSAGMNGIMQDDVMMRGGKMMIAPAPAPAIGVPAPGVVIDDGSGNAPPDVPLEPGPTD
jgi:hypothetical protein